MLRFHNNPFIVQAKSHSVYVENNTRWERVCYIYMEYANKRNLRKTISEYRGRSLPEYMIQRATRMILQGLHALHAQGYVHCDLKPDNLLLFHSTTHGELFDLKIADFGLSREPNSDYALPRGSLFPGTPRYMSHDILKPIGVIDPALDIWSLGCVVYEVFGGKPEQEFLEDYYEWRLFEDISPVAKDFLRQCHQVHPIRPNAAKLLEHPFITQTLTLPLPTIRQPQQGEEDWQMIQRLPDSIW